MTESEVLEVRIGDEHITPEQIMDVNIGTYGPGDYVFPTGQKLEAQLLSNNSIRIFDGAMVYCGVRDVIAVNNYHDVTIENGQQGMNRNDIIVRHFAKNEETQFGGAEFQVIKGTATSGDATDPEITDTDLRAGALTHDMKIYRARLEGLNVVAVEPLFEVLPSIPELNGKTFSFKQIYEGYAGGGYIDIPSISGANLVCIECVYANVTRGATTIPIEQFKKGYDCYATYGRDSNIWALAKYSSDTRVGINCGGSGGDVLCRISIL